MKKMMMAAVCALLIYFSSCDQTTSKTATAQLQASELKDSCDNPDANISCYFMNTPSGLTNVMMIGGQNEAGEKLVITGTIFKADGITPYPGVILYAYHTDNTGHYSKKGDETGVQKWHGHLHGWCKSGGKGQYEIRSIRPARYPGNAIPAHIHLAFKTPDGQMNYLNEYVFKDDSLVNKEYLSKLPDAGGTGVVDIKKTAQNVWTGKRDIIIK